MKRFIAIWILLSAGLNIWQMDKIRNLEEKKPMVVYKTDNAGAEIFGKVVEKGRHGKLYTITIRDYGVFVIAGNRRGFEDTRGTLFFEIARFASILRPKYLFLENVKGLLNHENGITFETIISTLDELGYNVEWQVLNSKDFGVPQNRERVFIIGHLRGECTRRVFPLSGKNQPTSSQSVVKIGNVNPSGNGMNGEVYQADGLAPTLTTNKGEGQKIAIKSNTIKQFGVLQPNFNQCGVVYETDGIAPTIRAYQGGGLEPKIIQRGHGYNQGGEHDIAPTLTSNSYHENNVLKITEATSQGYAEAQLEIA